LILECGKIRISEYQKTKKGPEKTTLIPSLGVSFYLFH
jgi:hypothetical protein